ncbi:LytTR family DNA-binding domain-containing protein [Rhodocytophaga aerolata]|uniref:LytTR family DNA-binding domain-containing protein n=1 Tax=Rhodocytophaga aerolata TaxID=455078 RepID=A0ABT8RGH4_9BACT|nr:LytTR family DNA-binding domain-containing protein [Rhodocytophaga aerolata]MDO1451202.1 LytTR family DNA-binding domain-containing protein [Rhodocytophaga aerolata]
MFFYKNEASLSASREKRTDLWVKVIGSFLASHFIEILGREESLFYLLLQKFYYIDVLSGFCIAFVLWEIISRVSRYLDRRLAWEEQTLQRALLQITFGVFIPSVLVHVLTYLQFTYIIGQEMSKTTWYTNELPVAVVIILIINSYYFTSHLYLNYQQLKQSAILLPNQETHKPAPERREPVAAKLSTEPASVKKKRQVFIISKGQRNIPLPVEEIAYFFTKDENNFLRTFANETFLIDESLEDIYSHVDEQLFFRANRQTIINFNACTYFSYLDHGKLQVALQPDTDEAVIISQKRSPLFKEWVRR